MQLRNFKNIFIGSTAAVGLVLSLQGCKSSNGEPAEHKAEAAAAPAATEVISLQKAHLSSALQIPGELLAFQQVDLYAKEASFVQKLYVDVGSEVKAGQLLVSMQAPELGSALAAADS